VTPVVLDVVHKVYSDLLVSFWSRTPLSKVLERGVVGVLKNFQFLSITTVLGVAVSLVQCDRFLVGAWYLVSEFEQCDTMPASPD
jgi:hypothetical protein